METNLNKLTCRIKQTATLTEETSFCDGWICLSDNELIFDWEGEFLEFPYTYSSFELLLEHTWENKYYYFSLTLEPTDGYFDEFSIEKNKEYDRCVQWFKTKELKEKLNDLPENNQSGIRIKI